MNIIPTILIVDDEINTREGLKSFLELHDYSVDVAADAYQAIDIIKTDMPDIVLTDLRMPNIDGITLLKKIKEFAPDTLVILFTAYGSVENAVAAMQAGAYHYLTKPVNTEELLSIVKKAILHRSLEQENKALRNELAEKNEFGEIIYKSAEMGAVIDMVKQVAPTTATILIEGESGTGKELIARMIHSLSLRKDEAFVPVHCAALTETLLASELFGHERGAFTGAVERKLGRFERAHKGTLFLDEVSEIKEEMQVNLLRVLQESEFERVGGTKIIKVDVRIISATNKVLADEVKNNNFRDDLFYRLNVVNIKIPPLRKRKADIEPLVQFYLKHYCVKNNKQTMTISSDAINALEQYDWPGNVRELKNVIERIVVLAKGNQLTLSNIPPDIRCYQKNIDEHVLKEIDDSYELLASSMNINDMEKVLIKKALNELNGNKSKVAKKLGISRRTLYRKLDDYNITNSTK